MIAVFAVSLILAVLIDARIEAGQAVSLRQRDALYLLMMGSLCGIVWEMALLLGM